MTKRLLALLAAIGLLAAVPARADLSPFADAGAVSPYAVEALQRAQAATLLMRLGEQYPA